MAARGVFGDDKGFRVKTFSSGGAAQKAEGLGVGVFVFVRRVEEDEVDGLREFLEERHYAPSVDRVASGDAKSGEVNVQGFEGGRGVFGEPDVACAAAKGFDPYGSGASVKVGKCGAGQAGRENVEQGLAQAVAGGAGGRSGWGGKEAGTVGSGDDAHGHYRNGRI